MAFAIPTTLYRLYSVDGTLLYIGIAQNWASRMKQHQEQKIWWRDVASTSFQIFPTREDAAVAEARAIKAERPIHNVVHNQRPESPPPPEGGLYLLCTECAREIPPHARAVLQVLQDQRTEQGRGYEDAIGTSGLLLRPVHWVISCPECVALREDEPEYSIGLSGTWPDLLANLAHLIGKDWIGSTDLPVVIAQIAQWNGPH